MKWVGGCLAIVLLAWPAARGEEPNKEKSAKERYDALVKEFQTKQREIIAQYQKTKGEEQQKLLQQYFGLGKDYADKFFKLAEEDPKSDVAKDALFWIVQNGSESGVFQKASEKVGALIAEMQLKELSQKLNAIQPNPSILDAVLKRADKDAKEASAADLIAWAATRASYLPAGQKAAQTLIEKYPDHSAIPQVLNALSRSNSPDAEKTLRKLSESSTNQNIKAAATLALAKVLANRVDSLGDNPAEGDKVTAEAEKYFKAAIELYKDNAAQKKAAESGLKALAIRPGKEAPEIKGPDLDGKDFKLSDYKGKVVLLDFWGNW
jgi:hypothetical protein